MINKINLEEYIKVDEKKFGYAQYTCRVYVRKDIPIDITNDDIADFVDGFNSNFGYTIERTGFDENYIKYKVTIYID